MRPRGVVGIAALMVLVPTTTATAAPDAVTEIGGAAAAAVPAVRLHPPLSECGELAQAIASRHPGLEQVIVVRSDTWSSSYASVEVAARSPTGWRCGPAMAARVGRNGLRPLAERRSGDGTTPAGVFPLGRMRAPDGQQFSFFGNAPDPGVTAGPYRRVQIGDCFGATPNTAGYGHLRSDTSCAGSADEYLPRFVDAYANAALIGANTEPNVSGDAPGEIPYAAAIFLHRTVAVPGVAGATKATSGCVSLAANDLVTVMTTMTPGAVFAIGTTTWLHDSA